MPSKQNEPGNRVNTLWVIVAVDADGDEGIPAFMGETGVMWPMVASTPRTLALCAQIAAASPRPGVRYEIRRYDTYVREAHIAHD